MAPAATAPAATAPVDTVTPAASRGWPEVERAVAQPAHSFSGSTAVDDTLRQRIRPANIAAGAAPQPPARSPLTGANPGDVGVPAAASSASMSPWDRPGRQPPANSSAAPLPAATVAAEDRAGPTLPAFPVNPPATVDSRPPQREVVYEGHPASNAVPNRRYFEPPTRTTETEYRPDRREIAPWRSDRPIETADASRAIADSSAPPAATPSLPPDRRGGVPSDKPWGPLLLAVVGLFGSLGFNLYLGWIAWDLYSRHQDAVNDVQQLETKLESKQQELATTLNSRSLSRRPTVATT